MSATAFSIFQAGEAVYGVFASDGVSYDRDQTIQQTNARKVFKLRDSTALVWMGARAEPIETVMNHLIGLDAEAAIRAVSEILQAAFDNEKSHNLLKDFPFNIHTFEVTGEGVQFWRCFYSEDTFTPVFKGTLQPGQNGAMVFDNPDGLNFAKYTREAKDVFNNTVKTQDIDVVLKTVVSTAFEQMVNEYAEQGYPVGGEIYIETITKP